MGYTGVDVFICHDSFVYNPYRVPTQRVGEDKLTLRRLSISCEDASPQPRRPQPRRLLYARAKSGRRNAIGEPANCMYLYVCLHVLYPYWPRLGFVISSGLRAY